MFYALTVILSAQGFLFRSRNNEGKSTKVAISFFIDYKRLKSSSCLTKHDKYMYDQENYKVQKNNRTNKTTTTILRS